ncbi:MAG: ISAs1 family transposase, partial [Gammaproteobacteria bacterium]|nr:ISAs1 family transposase [Gammaproteobacteria bacterium]
NQKGLFDQTEKVFEITEPASCYIQNDMGHGRIEKRVCSVIDDLTFFDDYKDWPGIKSLIRVEAQRTNKTSGKEENSIRYYISSKKAAAEVFNQDIRSHWAIENKLHWILDVNFKEDASRKRKGNSASNFSIMTKIALMLIEKNKDKIPRSQKMQRAAFNADFREKLLGI